MPCDKQVDENFQGIVITVDAGQAEAKPDRKEKPDKKAVAQWQNRHECGQSILYLSGAGCLKIR